MDIPVKPVVEITSTMKVGAEDDLRNVSSNDEMPKVAIRRRLTTAQRKRYKWLTNHGHPHDEAIDLCKLTIAAREGRTPAFASKRTRLEDATPDTTALNKKERINTPQSLTSSGADCGEPNRNQPNCGETEVVEVAIIPTNFPEVCLALNQQKALEEKIFNLILACKERPGPYFEGMSFRPGHIVINCGNAFTTEWLKSQECAIQLPDIEIKIIDAKEVPSPYILSGFFPDSLNLLSTQICSLIGIQNNVPAEQWKVLKMSDARNNCVEVVFSVDPASFDAIKAKNFCIGYKMDTMKLLPKIMAPYRKPSQQSASSQYNVTAGKGESATSTQAES